MIAFSGFSHASAMAGSRSVAGRGERGGTWKADPPVVMQLKQQTHEHRMHVIGYCDGGKRSDQKNIFSEVEKDLKKY